MELMRQALRVYIKKIITDNSDSEYVKNIIIQFAPIVPEHFATVAQTVAI